MLYHELPEALLSMNVGSPQSCSRQLTGRREIASSLRLTPWVVSAPGARGGGPTCPELPLVQQGARESSI